MGLCTESRGGAGIGLLKVQMQSRQCVRWPQGLAGNLMLANVTATSHNRIPTFPPTAVQCLKAIQSVISAACWETDSSGRQEGI